MAVQPTYNIGVPICTVESEGGWPRRNQPHRAPQAKLDCRFVTKIITAEPMACKRICSLSRKGPKIFRVTLLQYTFLYDIAQQVLHRSFLTLTHDPEIFCLISSRPRSVVVAPLVLEELLWSDHHLSCFEGVVPAAPPKPHDS